MAATCLKTVVTGSCLPLYCCNSYGGMFSVQGLLCHIFCFQIFLNSSSLLLPLSQTFFLKICCCHQIRNQEIMIENSFQLNVGSECFANHHILLLHFKQLLWNWVDFANKVTAAILEIGLNWFPFLVRQFKCTHHLLWNYCITWSVTVLSGPVESRRLCLNFLVFFELIKDAIDFPKRFANPDTTKLHNLLCNNSTVLLPRVRILRLCVVSVSKTCWCRC